MENQLVTIIQTNELEPSKGQALLANFKAFFDQTEGFEKRALAIKVTDESQVDVIKQAKEMRKQLQQIRIETEKARVRLKEQSLREGKAIDGMANVIKAIITPLEEHLEAQEKFAENQRLEREEALRQERGKLMEEVGALFSSVDLGKISEEDFQSIYQAAKTRKEQADAEAQRLEQERIEKEKAEAAEQERIRKENEALKKEAIKKEAERQKELAKAEKERLEREKEAEKTRKEFEAKLAAEEAQKKAVANEKAKIQKELEDRKRAEEKRIADEKAAEKKALAAPDKEKLLAFSETLSKAKPMQMGTPEGEAIAREIYAKVISLSLFIKEQAAKL